MRKTSRIFVQGTSRTSIETHLARNNKLYLKIIQYGQNKEGKSTIAQIIIFDNKNLLDIRDAIIQSITLIKETNNALDQGVMDKNQWTLPEKGHSRGNPPG